jgi:hypothetical protein
VRAHAQICACARTFQFCSIEEILWGILYIEKKRRRQAVTNFALSRCRHSLAAAKLPPTSRFRAAATAAADELLTPR